MPDRRPQNRFYDADAVHPPPVAAETMSEADRVWRAVSLSVTPS